MLFIHLYLYAPYELIQTVSRISIGNFYMYRTIPCIRAIVVKHKIICSLDVRETGNGFFYALCQVGIIPLAKYL